MEGILQQAPDGITLEDIEPLYKKYDGNVPNILADLWQVVADKQPVLNITVEEMKIKNKFAEVRDICNAMDEEFEAYMKKCKTKSI
jgi:hypothetical protein